MGVSRRLPLVLAAVGSATSLAGIAGWVLGWPALYTVVPGTTGMKLNTAVCLAVLGIATLLLLARARGAAPVALAAAGFVALVAGATLTQVVASVDFGIDELLVADPTASAAPGRMAPNTALAIILLAGGLATVAGRRPVPMRLLLCATSGLVGWLALFGYSTGLEPLIGLGSFTRMSLEAAASLLLLSAALIAAELPDARGQASATERIFRRVGPTLAALPFGLLLGHRLASLNTASLEMWPWVAGMLTVGSVAVALAIALREATRAERRARLAEDALRASNRRLAMLGAVNEALLGGGSERELLDRVCHIATAVGGYRLSWVGAARKDFRVEPIAFSGRDDAYVAHASIRWDGPPSGLGPTGRAARERSPQIGRDSAAIPFQLGDEVGVFHAYAARADAFADEEVQTLVQMANNLAVGLSAIRATLARADAERALRESESKYRLLAENAKDLVTMTDPDGRFTYVSPSAQSLLGYQADELLGTRAAELIHPDDVEPYRAERQRMIASGVVSGFRLRLRRKDGAHVWIEATSNPVVRDGQVLGVLSVIRDVTARLHAEEEVRRLNATLERRVEERTAELAAANKELEAFAYSVSHDLRAPLRAIDGFSKALLEDYKDKLDAEGQDDLARVRAATQRMGSLIDDILKLSRISRAELRVERVDLSAMATEMLQELRASSPGRVVETFVQGGLVAEGDGTLLRVVLQNLFENAWKFTSKHETATIEFGQERRPEGLVFFVRDDGAGFDPRYAEKLFGAFQRLHSPSDFPGNGIGLATVKRILARHGGTVWAEGQPEKGATFYFTIPSKVTP